MICIVKTSRTLPGSYFHAQTRGGEQLQRCLSLIVYHYKMFSCSVWHFHNHIKSELFCIQPLQSSFHSTHIEMIVRSYCKRQRLEKLLQSNCHHSHFCLRMCTSFDTFVITFDIQDACMVSQSIPECHQ